MPYFKDIEYKLHFLSDEDIANGGLALLPEGCVEITAEESFVISPNQSESDIIKSKISELEAAVTPRRMREAVLGIDNGWLERQDSAIAALREKL